MNKETRERVKEEEGEKGRISGGESAVNERGNKERREEKKGEEKTSEGGEGKGESEEDGKVNEKTKNNNPSSENGEDTHSTNVSEESITFTPRFGGFVTGFAVLFTGSIISLHPGGIAASIAVLLFLIGGFVEKPSPPGDHLKVTHEIHSLTPKPGDEIRVEVTIRNTSEKTLTDVRVVDRVPEALEVVTGSPRGVCTLQPQEELTLSYTVVGKRGVFEFSGVRARNRAVMGSMWVDSLIKPEAIQTVNCTIDPNNTPLDNQASQYIGQLLGDTGGDGVEFFKTREYHRGDSPSRINWRDLAKTGELSTITYREQQATEITILLDAREYAHVAESTSNPPASVLSSYTAYELTAALTADGHRVGVVVPGLLPEQDSGMNSDSLPYEFIPHGNGVSQTRRAFELIERVETLAEDSVHGTRLSETIPECETQFNRQAGSPITTRETTNNSGNVFDEVHNLRFGEFTNTITSLTMSDGQCIILTPLLDENMFELCKHIHSTKTPLLIISPDVTQTKPEKKTTTALEETAGNISRRLLSVQRATRIESLRARDIPVIDWKSEDTLSSACEQQTRAGGR